jgi:hypothetical protein
MIIEGALGSALLLICSCDAHQGFGFNHLAGTNQTASASATQREGHSFDLKGISIDDAVLVYMITNLDDAAHFVYFIEPTNLIRDLSPRWGAKYRVYPTQDAEWLPYGIRGGKRLRLKGTNQEGRILDVQVQQVEGDKADAIGTSEDAFHGKSYQFHLRRVDHEWRIVSAALKMVPDHRNL